MQLRLATDFEKLERDKLTHSAWGQRLSVAQYLERERRLRAHAYSRGQMRTWMLVDGAKIAASCETFAMEARSRGEKGVIEGVASVFVEPELRGRGFSTSMFRLLLDRLRGEGALGSILYSDVGESIYARVGYAALPALERIFSSAPGDPEHVCDAFDERAVAEELAAAPVPDDPLLVWPSATQLDWHIERERIYSELLGAVRPRFHGARAGRSRAFWCADLKNERLVVLLLAAERADEAAALVEMARRTAHEAQLGQVVLWECGWKVELPGFPVARSESLPMICPLRPGIQPRDWRQTSRATWI